MSDIQVTMLGSFSIERNGQRVDDSSNRMKKVWLVLAYLIYSRNSTASQDSIYALLQSGTDDSADPSGRIKGIFYRIRSMLNQLDDAAGHELIIHKRGTYAWNNQFPLHLDVEAFEALCNAASKEEDETAALSLYLQALELYKGDFLPKLSMEPWCMPINTYYHQMYLTAAEQALFLLEKADRWADCLALCRRALKIEPYSETLYQYLMRSLIAQEDRPAALQAYEEMSELLFSTFGVMPSDESRQLYRLASREGDSLTVSTGSIRIDGKDIRDVTQKSIHESIGIVQQDVFLFADTIFENIRYGKPDATMEEVVEAAKKAEIYDDILAMPRGFDTYVGERGTLLSGGQKQRVAIARIFLKNPPILILDEATSALDSVTEAKIQRAFDNLAVGRTTLIIAHRLSTIRNATRIVSIADGVITECGSHEELVNTGGVYSQLYKTQNALALEAMK